MSEANAGDAVVSSQNSNDGAASQQSLEQKFFHLFDTYVAGKETLVINATQYSAVLDAILRNQRGEKVSNPKEHNWIKRMVKMLLYRKDGNVVVRESVVVKPLLSEDFNSRCQVDLIDLQSRPDNSYSFLMVYQDHLTKFVVLRASSWCRFSRRHTRNVSLHVHG